MKTFKRMTVNDLPEAVHKEISEAVLLADNRTRFAMSLLMKSTGELLLNGAEIYDLYFSLSSAIERLEIAAEALKLYDPEARNVDG